MEKVKIRKCESIMDGKAHAVELADGRKATAWCDKVDCKTLKLAYDTMSEVEIELKPWESKGKTGLNIVKIFPDLQTIYDTKQGNASANGQYQKSVAEENEMAKTYLSKPGWEERNPPEMPKPEDFKEADITSINAKSSVKIKKNSKGIGWEVKVVTGEIDLINELGQAAIGVHKKLCIEFPVETVHAV